MPDTSENPCECHLASLVLRSKVAGELAVSYFQGNWDQTLSHPNILFFKLWQFTPLKGCNITSEFTLCLV